MGAKDEVMFELKIQYMRSRRGFVCAGLVGLIKCQRQMTIYIYLYVVEFSYAGPVTASPESGVDNVFGYTLYVSFKDWVTVSLFRD